MLKASLLLAFFIESLAHDCEVPQEVTFLQTSVSTVRSEAGKVGYRHKVENHSSVEVTQIVYGKYYSKADDGSHDFTDNSYYLFRPKHLVGNGKLPVVIGIHPGGLINGEPITAPEDEINTLAAQGMASISLGYRLVTRKYYYDDGSLEEYIHTDADGRLALDSGRTMVTHSTKIGRYEFVTKPLYDAVQMMENLIANADRLGIDVHRVSFQSCSISGIIANYLIWVYHRWNVGRYTPVGYLYTYPQTNYPIDPALDSVWDVLAENLGDDAKLSMMLSHDDCSYVVGNVMCTGVDSEYDLCNRTWHTEAMNRFCGANFADVTFRELRTAAGGQRARKEGRKEGRTERRKEEMNSGENDGLETLLYTSRNVLKHVPSREFKLLVYATHNDTEYMGFVHHAIWGAHWAQLAEMAKFEYMAYYPDFEGMKAAQLGQLRLQQADQVVLNYRTNSKTWNATSVFTGWSAFHAFALKGD